MILAFGAVAVGAMLLFYALEERSHWFVLGFAFASAAAAIYGGVIAAWPFAAIEGIWSLVALRRWWRRYAAGRPTRSHDRRILGISLIDERS